MRASVTNWLGKMRSLQLCRQGPHPGCGRQALLL